ncbi:hypothetical protein COAQ111491_13800 [Comamonas aquatilis]
MKKIVIVGHPQSGYEKVEHLLVECGMARAEPSRREGLTPVQINDTLMKAHGAVSLAQLESVEQLQQITVAPIWQGMALDLMLTNLDQRLWGWADPQAIYLLDYWKEQDPNVVFVMVYAEPETMLTRMPIEQAASSQGELRHRMNVWKAYNAALLCFHLRNPGRSILVHARQVQASAQISLGHISARIDAILHLPPNLLASLKVDGLAANAALAAGGNAEDIGAQFQHIQGKRFKKARKRLRARLQALQAGTEQQLKAMPVLQAEVEQSVAKASMLEQTTATDSTPAEWEGLGDDALVALLAHQLLGADSQVIQLYGELQAAATLPHEVVGQPEDQSSGACNAAWQTLVDQRLALQEQARYVKMQASQIEALNEHASHLAQNHRLLQNDWHDLQVLKEGLTSRLAQADQKEQAAEIEGRQLLSRLHQVQEEMLYHSTQEKQRTLHLADAQMQISQLKIELDAVRSSSTESNVLLAQENELLLAQLYQVQEELERHHRHAEEQAHKLAQAHQREQVLGAEVSRLLAGLHQVQEDVECSRMQGKQQTLQLIDAQTQIDQLKAELGAARADSNATEPNSALEQENELLLMQLQQVHVQLERYYLESQCLKPLESVAPSLTTVAATKVPRQPDTRMIYFGAGERIRQQLSYKLGSVMIAHTKKKGGYLSLPWALWKVSRQHEIERPQREALKLPPINRYRDSWEADRHRQHLSYRLGSTLLQNLRSPLGWLRMPGALWLDVREYRQRQACN